MNAKHTPGPWHVERRLSCWAITDGKGQDLTYQDDAPRFYAGEPCGSITSRGRTEDELSANARLIAAAPELLEACERALPWIGKLIADGGHMHSVAPNDAVGAMGQLAAAIAKATGGDHA